MTKSIDDVLLCGWKHIYHRMKCLCEEVLVLAKTRPLR